MAALTSSCSVNEECDENGSKKLSEEEQDKSAKRKIFPLIFRTVRVNSSTFHLRLLLLDVLLPLTSLFISEKRYQKYKSVKKPSQTTKLFADTSVALINLIIVCQAFRVRKPLSI